MAQNTAPPKGSPLAVLPSMLHAVFMQTANVFNDPRKHSSRAVVSTNALIRLGVPAAIDRFQYALDCLEVEVLRAKATFRRDLEVLRQKAAQEAKAIAEREAEEARAKALAEEEVAQERREKEEKEAQENAAAAKAQEETTAPVPNNTDSQLNVNTEASLESNDKSQSNQPTATLGGGQSSVARNTSTINDDDIDLLFDASPVEGPEQQKRGQTYSSIGGPPLQNISQTMEEPAIETVSQVQGPSPDANRVGPKTTENGANPNPGIQKSASNFDDLGGMANLDDYGTFGEEFDNLYMYP